MKHENSQDVHIHEYTHTREFETVLTYTYTQRERETHTHTRKDRHFAQTETSDGQFGQYSSQPLHKKAEEEQGPSGLHTCMSSM